MLVDSIMMIYLLVFPYFLCFLTGSKKMVYGHIAIWGIYNHISVWALNKFYVEASLDAMLVGVFGLAYYIVIYLVDGDLEAYYNKVLEGAKTTKLLDFVVIPGIILMVVCSVIIGNELWNEFEDELLVYSVILTVILTVEAIIYYRSIKSQMKLVIDEGGNDEVKNR